MVIVEFEAEIKKWGNSQGIIIPQEHAKKFMQKKVKVHLMEPEDPMKQYDGTLNLDTPIDQLMREIDEELWDE